MGATEDIKTILQDVVTPDMKDIKDRLTALENKVMSTRKTIPLATLVEWLDEVDAEEVDGERTIDRLRWRLARHVYGANADVALYDADAVLDYLDEMAKRGR